MFRPEGVDAWVPFTVFINGFSLAWNLGMKVRLAGWLAGEKHIQSPPAQMCITNQVLLLLLLLCLGSSVWTEVYHLCICSHDFACE